MNQQHYTYRITWSEDDLEFVGLCIEFPSLSHLAATEEEALKGIKVLIADVVEDLMANKEPIPEPVASKKYSGKFVVRVPPAVHRKLAIEAMEENVSLNRLVASKLG